MKTNLKPLFDNVLIKPLEAEIKTASGLILPDSAKEKPQIGEVVAVGAGRVGPKGEVEPMMIKVGQKVVFRKWGGDEIKVEGKDYVMIKQGDVLALME